MEEIVKKIKEGQVHASQKIEIGETSVQRPERMPLQMLQQRQKGTKQIATKKKKNWTLMYILPYSTSLYVFHKDYNSLFTSSNPSDMNEILDAIWPSVSTDMNIQLSKPFSREEVDTTIKEMDPIKAPRPDGLRFSIILSGLFLVMMYILLFWIA